VVGEEKMKKLNMGVLPTKSKNTKISSRKKEKIWMNGIYVLRRNLKDDLDYTFNWRNDIEYQFI
jgi:hypothetical protein